MLSKTHVMIRFRRSLRGLRMWYNAGPIETAMPTIAKNHTVLVKVKNPVTRVTTLTLDSILLISSAIDKS